MIPLREAGYLSPLRERDGISWEHHHRLRVLTRHRRQSLVQIRRADHFDGLELQMKQAW